MIPNASEDAEMLGPVFTVPGNEEWHSHPKKKEYYFLEVLLVLCLYEVEHELCLPCNSTVSCAFYSGGGEHFHKTPCMNI